MNMHYRSNGGILNERGIEILDDLFELRDEIDPAKKLAGYILVLKNIYGPAEQEFDYDVKNKSKLWQLVRKEIGKVLKQISFVETEANKFKELKKLEAELQKVGSAIDSVEEDLKLTKLELETDYIRELVSILNDERNKFV